jgi:AraC-like DNA-binding protein
MVKKLLLSPRPSLARYVSHMVVLEYQGGRGEVTLPLIANGHPSIVFQSIQGSIAGRAVGYLSAYGQNKQPFPLMLKERFTLIACFLHPYFLQPFFGVRASELTDVCIDLELLQPVWQRTIKERLLNAATLEQRLQLMEALILQLAGTGREPARDVHAATAAIRKSEGCCSLAALQKDLRITERSLQRLFEINIGLTPRMYGRICQFDAAFQQLNAHHFTRLSDIAYHHGYSDQSHFIRAFKEFALLTPSEYMQKAAAFTA